MRTLPSARWSLTLWSSTLSSLPGKLRRAKRTTVLPASTDARSDARKLLLDMPADEVIQLLEDNAPTRI